jgi:hypothetical protein
VRGLLRRQPPLEHRFDHFRDEAALAGQLQRTGVDPRHQIIEQPRIHHLVDRPPGRRRLGRLRAEHDAPLWIFGHGHCVLPSGSGSCTQTT